MVKHVEMEKKEDRELKTEKTSKLGFLEKIIAWKSRGLPWPFIILDRSKLVWTNQNFLDMIQKVKFS